MSSASNDSFIHVIAVMRVGGVAGSTVVVSSEELLRGMAAEASDDEEEGEGRLN